MQMPATPEQLTLSVCAACAAVAPATIFQRQITRFDSAEYFLGKEGKKPTDGLCLVSDHAPPPPKPRFVDCSTAPASRNSRLRGCSQ